MARSFSFCDKRGHNTIECWYKNKHLKEISREDGKLKKKYNLPPSTSSSKNRVTIHAEKRNKSRSRSPTPYKNENPGSTGSKTKQSTPPINSRTYGKKSPPRPLLQDIGAGGEIIDLTNKSKTKSTPQKSFSKCEECLRWNRRMSETLAYQEITRNENKKIIKELKEINMELNEKLNKTIQERDSFKKLYEINAN